jgi:hypothetical protein
VAPSLERRTYPLASGTLAALPAPVTVVGIARAADPAVHDRPLAAGAPLGTGDDDGALVSAELARSDGLGVGSTITLLGDPRWTRPPSGRLSSPRPGPAG